MTGSEQPGRAVVLLSGGLDSAVTLAVAARRDGRACHAITFDYGQRHRHELDAADRVARSVGLSPEQTLRLRVDLAAIGGSALTDRGIDVPKTARAEAPPTPTPATPSLPLISSPPPIPITYVPARNLIFLSCAAAYAETLGARSIYLGVNAVDYSGYPDCREPFLRAFEAAAALGTKAGVEAADRHAPTLRIHSPLVHLSKAQIIRLGADLGVDFALTHSCYDPVVRTGEVLACGACDSCRIRREGFVAAGVPDPTRYA